MGGGFDAWSGLVSRRPIDRGVAVLQGDETPGEAIAIAYAMEEQARSGYEALLRRNPEGEVARLLDQLVGAEGGHLDLLRERFDQGGYAGDLPGLAGAKAAQTEGGLSPEAFAGAVAASAGDARELLETAMGMEVDSLDLYLQLSQRSEDPAAEEVFRTIADGEVQHLRWLGELMGRTAGSENGAG